MSPSWRKIPAQELKRSSHSLCVVKGKAYIFGGEIEPRKPVDNRLHVVDVQSGEYEAVQGEGDVPEARVGHTGVAVGDNIYIFGGRGGPEMTPLTPALHIFSASSSTWRTVPAGGADGPVARSYHASAASSTHVFVHAGCGDASTGRLKDTWAFDIATEKWQKLADGPGDVRGGTALCYSSAEGSTGLWRFGGFNGKTEIGGQIDHLPLSSNGSSLADAQWTTHTFGETAGHGRKDSKSDGLQTDETVPGARSVCGIHPDEKSGKLITMFGEGKPSPTGGHDAAGNFWGDVWSFDPKTKEWQAVRPQVEGEAAGAGAAGPGERGWFASDAAAGQGLVVWGGIDKDNERLGDGWVLTA